MAKPATQRPKLPSVGRLGLVEPQAQADLDRLGWNTDAHVELLRRRVLGNPHSNNPTSLATTALVQQAQEEDPDYRTRLLIRDSAEALRSYWGETRFEQWLMNCPVRARIEAICAMLPEASLIPIMLGISASRRTVAGSMFTAVRGCTL